MYYRWSDAIRKNAVIQSILVYSLLIILSFYAFMYSYDLFNAVRVITSNDREVSRDFQSDYIVEYEVDGNTTRMIERSGREIVANDVKVSFSSKISDVCRYSEPDNILVIGLPENYKLMFVVEGGIAMPICSSFLLTFAMLYAKRDGKFVVLSNPLNFRLFLILSIYLSLLVVLSFMLL